MWYVMSTTWGMPTPDVEYRLALRILDQQPPLDRDILEALVGRPQRYKELKPLLAGRNDNVLTKALARLRGDGVILQTIEARSATKRYALTELGKLVVFRLHEMVPHHQSIQAYERGVRSSA
jgi:DNA-binding HxlR family transcriptional regulator